jgi:hypothetical protein
LSRRQVPFGGHQLAEYTLAAALVGVGIHLNGRPALVLIVGGGVIGALSLVSKGPLAAARLLPKRLHLYLDLLVAAAFALSPLAYLHNLQVIPIILCEAVAVLLVRMSLTTEIVPRPRPERTGPPSRAARLGAMLASRPPRATKEQMGAAAPGSAARPGSAPASAAGSRSGRRPTAAAPATSGASTDSGASRAETAALVATTAGRVVGTAVAKARNSGAPAAAARGLGRATGHARRIGRAAREARSAPAPAEPGPAPAGPATPSD